ncbi:MAG TPA: DEAD/DEAH box helicase [Thermoleophilaceae bacterium]
MSSRTFADLGASSAVVTALAERGIEEPFPVQGLVLPDVLAGRDVLVKSPTGSGKTLAFGVPMVDRIEASDPRPSALVLVPTRELAGQIVEELRTVAHARALSIAAVYGGAGIERQSKLAKRAHILVATPGRLEDLLERRAVKLDQIKILVLDEADRMLDMGFRPAVDRIVRRTPRKRQTLFFSATLDGAAGQIADAYTHDARSHELATKPEREADIRHRFVAVTHDSKLDTLVRELRDKEHGQRRLVFVRTKHGADRLVKRLQKHNIDALAMHGNKTQSQREKALARFEGGQVDTLVATDVAARGLDIDRITHVINFDPPGDSEGYVHRIGRTGRAGRTGIGTTFVSADDAGDVRKIAHGLRLHQEFDQAGFAAPARRAETHNGGRARRGGNRRRRPSAGKRS